MQFRFLKFWFEILKLPIEIFLFITQYGMLEELRRIHVLRPFLINGALFIIFLNYIKIIINQNY